MSADFAKDGSISLLCTSSSIPEELVMAELDETTPIKNTQSLPRSARRCRIPKLNRSSSVRLRTDGNDSPRPCDTRPKSMTISTSRDYPWPMESRYGDLGSVTSMPFSIDDDHSSVKSFGSFASFNSSFASQSQRTETPMSSRPLSSRTHCKKYVLHCDRHLAKQEEYLTPTQRKDREIRHLKSALMKQTRLCEEKQAEVERLKTEVERVQEVLTELRVGKESLMNSSQESDSLNAKNSTSEISFESQVTDKSDMQASMTLNDDSGISNTTSGSPRDSAELDDLEIQTGELKTAEKSVCTDLSLFDCPSPVNMTETAPRATTDSSQQSCSESSATESGNDNSVASEPQEDFAITASPRLSQEFERFLSTYQKELDLLKAQHKEHYYDLKDRFNDRVDDLLQKLTEANSRYLELRPLFDRAQDKIQSIESQLGDVQKDMESQEDYHKQMYFKMYRWKNTLKACLCVSVVGLAVHRIQPFIHIPDLSSTFQYYFNRSMVYGGLCNLTNWVELKLQ